MNAVQRIARRAASELKWRYSAERLETVHLALTYRCNLACRTCGSWRIGKEQAPHEMPLDEVLALVDQLPALGVTSCYLVGSEVLLFEGCLDVVRRLHSYGIACSLLSNGALVDEAMAADIVRAGTTHVTISLDGNEPVHDKLRGHKSFERALRGIDNLVAARAAASSTMGLGAHMTISHPNVEAVRFVSDFCAEKGIELSFQPVSYASSELIERSRVLGEAASTPRFRPAVGFGLTEDDLRRLKVIQRELLEIGRSYPSLFLITALPVKQLAAGAYPIGPCQSIRHEVVVEPDGRVITCANVDAFAIGNVREKPLGEIWASERRTKLAAALRGKDAPDICVTCCNFRSNLTLPTYVNAAMQYAAQQAAVWRRGHRAS
jgi:radical SAM protein with 4Fe4S-binding SPASM domain